MSCTSALRTPRAFAARLRHRFHPVMPAYPQGKRSSAAPGRKPLCENERSENGKEKS